MYRLLETQVRVISVAFSIFILLSWSPNLAIASPSAAAEEPTKQETAERIDQQYNYNYLDTATRDRFYCSQLVWASFKDNYGIDISTAFAGPAIYPMEILDSPNVQLVYRNA